MRAFVLTAPFHGGVAEVPDPVPASRDVVVEVELVGICGTDVEFFTGEMPFLHDGNARYPIRLGHEWVGRVVRVGDDVDPRWLGLRVMGDTMLGDGTCDLCRRGRQHLCANRQEVGVRGGRDGGLAEQIAVPVTSLHEIPEEMDPSCAALVEPAGNSIRAVHVGEVDRGDRVLVIGAGTIGLLAALYAQALGAEVHVLGRSERSRAFAAEIGLVDVWDRDSLPRKDFDVVIDASNSPSASAQALELVLPGGRVVCVGMAAAPSLIDTRDLVLSDVTVVGVLSGSPAFARTIEVLHTGIFDPRPLVAATVGLDRVADVLAGWRPAGAGRGPKVLIDPRNVET